MGVSLPIRAGPKRRRRCALPHSKTPWFFGRHALEEGGVCRAATDRLFENDRIPPPTGEHGTVKKSPAETRRRGEGFHLIGFLSVPASLRDKVPPGGAKRTAIRLSYSEGESVPVSRQAVERLSGDASPYRDWNGRGGKGGANRPGERRAADALVEDFEVPHGLPLNGSGS
jgi:hypothetical protein